MEITHKALRAGGLVETNFRVGGLVETNGCSEFYDGTVGMIIKIEHFKRYVEYTVLIGEERWVLSRCELIDGE